MEWMRLCPNPRVAPSMANIRCSKFHAKDEKKQKERKVQHQARPYQLALLSQAIHVPGLLESSVMESRAAQQNEGLQMEQAMTQTDDNDPQPQAKRKISRAVSMPLTLSPTASEEEDVSSSETGHSQ